MKILQICKKNPFPPRDGETKAIDVLARGLMNQGVEVEVLSFNTTKHYVSPEEYNESPYPIDSIPLDNSIRYLDILNYVLKGLSPNFQRFDSPDMHQKIREILQDRAFDLIHLEGSYLIPYIETIRSVIQAPIVIRTHNVEYQIWQRLAKGKQGLVNVIYNLLAKRMEKYELEGLKKTDGLIAISELDLNIFRQMGISQDAIVIPMGVEMMPGSIPVNDNQENPTHSVAFLGSMDWEPNIEGVHWFVEKIWPLVLEKRPNTHFYLAGRNMPSSYFEWNKPGIQVVGEVSCPYEFLKDKALVAIPLLSGSGMRIKAVEAMAYGVPLVSTSVGIEGIPAKHGQDLMIADTSRQFADAICHLLDDDKLRSELSLAAKRLVEHHFDNTVLTDRLIQFYKQLIKS